MSPKLTVLRFESLRCHLFWNKEEILTLINNFFSLIFIYNSFDSSVEDVVS